MALQFRDLSNPARGPNSDTFAIYSTLLIAIQDFSTSYIQIQLRATYVPANNMYFAMLIIRSLVSLKPIFRISAASSGFSF
jgi:hypothetical protein